MKIKHTRMLSHIVNPKNNFDKLAFNLLRLNKKKKPFILLHNQSRRDCETLKAAQQSAIDGKSAHLS